MNKIQTDQLYEITEQDLKHLKYVIRDLTFGLALEDSRVVLAAVAAVSQSVVLNDGHRKVDKTNPKGPVLGVFMCENSIVQALLDNGAASAAQEDLSYTTRRHLIEYSYRPAIPGRDSHFMIVAIYKRDED